MSRFHREGRSIIASLDSTKKIDLIKKVFTNVTKKNPDYTWTKNLSSRVYQNAFRNLKSAFSRFFKGLGKYPRYKKKKHHIRLETLNIKGLMQNKKLAFYFADASFYKFKTLLQNKALSHGGIVESVNVFYPSSRLCSQCGNKKTDLKLKDRIYHCSNVECKPICRDLNSALNLANVSPKYITEKIGSARAEYTLVDNLPPTELVEAGSEPQSE